MKSMNRKMDIRKSIALIAHDNKKERLLSWSKRHQSTLSKHQLFGTDTTGHLLVDTLNENVTCLLSGLMGGDQQPGSKISQGEIDILIFFWDPLEQQPHDPDVKALLRIAAV